MKKSPASVLLVLLALSAPLNAAIWHVAGNGDDTRAGTAPDAAFRTLQRAASVVAPGDTVLIGDGIYTDGNTGEHSSLLNIAISGSPDAWITWKAAPGARPELRPTGWNGIRVVASYQIIEGLTLIGANDSITLIDALADAKIKEKDGKKYPGSTRFNTNGIFITGREQRPDRKPHHVIVRGCTIAKFPGGGLTAIQADYVTFEDNLIYGNAWYMRYGGSGITTLTNWAHDDAPGYHVLIQRNKVWDNKTLVPWEVVGKLSDGNGIILDITDDTLGGAANNPNGDTGPKPAATPATAAPAADPAKPERPPYRGRTLIANNISAYNGGSGIHTFKTRHVDIINNTTYWNGQIVGYQEIFANRSEDVVILNNIIVPRPAGKVTSVNRNKDVRWDHNLYPEAQTVLTGPNDVVGDPLFVRIDTDLRRADFRLQPGSPALDRAIDDVAQPADHDGKPRPAGRARDLGAYEQ